jgi:hypothetical protein
VGEKPTVFKGIQVRSRGSSYAQVCAQFIQGDVPIGPDRLCVWDEKKEIFGGRPKLSTWLSPVVDNLIKHLKNNMIRLMICATMRSVSESDNLLKGVEEQGITSAETLEHHLQNTKRRLKNQRGFC